MAEYTKLMYIFNVQTHPTQQVVSVSSTEQSSQSQILLQCRPSGLDLTASTLHTKLLPQPTTSNTEKDEIFAVPKVSISLVLMYRID